jgi:hypothetical protein
MLAREPRVLGRIDPFQDELHLGQLLVRAAPAASFLRLYPKRPGPRLVLLFDRFPPGRFR